MSILTIEDLFAVEAGRGDVVGATGARLDLPRFSLLSFFARERTLSFGTIAVPADRPKVVFDRPSPRGNRLDMVYFKPNARIIGCRLPAQAAAEVVAFHYEEPKC